MRIRQLKQSEIVFCRPWHLELQKSTAGFKGSEGQRPHITSRWNFMGSLENCLLLNLLRVKLIWCKTAWQQSFQLIMLIYSRVLFGPNSITVSVAGP